MWNHLKEIHRDSLIIQLPKDTKVNLQTQDKIQNKRI